MRMIRARYKKHTRSFQPMEPIELPDNATVDIVVPDAVSPDSADPLIVPEPTPAAMEAFRRSAGGWRDLMPDEFIDEVYKRREIRRHRIDL